MRRIRLRYPPAFLILPLVFSSCATILNKPLQQIAITPGPGIEIVSVAKGRLVDHPLIGSGEARVYVVPRSNNPLAVRVRVDTSYKTVELKPRHSVAYWSNIYFNDGIGMLWDRRTEKRYGYRPFNYFAVRDTAVRSRRFAPVGKGRFEISVYYPFTTIFRVTSPQGAYRSAGVLGLGGGLSYYYKDDHYFSMEAGAATDRFGEHFGTGYVESASVIYGSLRTGRSVGSFDISGGLSLSRLRWTRQTIGDTVQMDASLTGVGLGPSLGIRYRLGNYIAAGVLYQPVVWQPASGAAQGYQHSVSLQLVFQLPVR